MDDMGEPDLTEHEKQEAADRTSVKATVVHETVRYDGEEELNRPWSGLAWSALAAGFSMGLSLVAMALFQAYLPDTPWRPMIVRLGYPLGFLVVITGRQQLFTENTLTAIIPLLVRRNLSTLWSVCKLWTIVLISNVTGAFCFAWIVATTQMLHPEVRHAMLQLATEAADVGVGVAILRGIFAGWLIAMVVWMLAAVDNGRFMVIIILTYVVALAGLTHIIAGSVEMLFLVMVGAKTFVSVLIGYMLPTLLGNCIGGVALTAALNHAQAVAGRSKKLAPSLIHQFR